MVLKIKTLSESLHNANAASLARKFPLIDAVMAASYVWESVSAETIKNCFKHCGFKVPQSANEAQLTEDDEIQAVISTS